MRYRIVVLGSNFAGFTAALALKRLLGSAHDVLVISPKDEFVFTPALVRVPFGLRDRNNIGFPVRPAFERAGVAFKQLPVTKIEMSEKRVVTAVGIETYDYLVVATGAIPDYDSVTGLNPSMLHNQSVMTWDDAQRARVAFERLVLNPGPAVLGVVQNGWHFSVAYELALGLANAVRRRGLSSRVPVTFVTPEPYLGHFGVDGISTSRAILESEFHQLGIQCVFDSSVSRIVEHEVILEGGRVLPSSYTLLMPPVRGADVVRKCTDVVDEHGFVSVDHGYQTFGYREVFAAGSAIAIGESHGTPAPRGLPKSGYFAEETARIVAYNIAACIRGDKLLRLTPAAIDARGVMDAALSVGQKSDVAPEPSMVPGLHGHWAHSAFLKYFSGTKVQ